MSERARRRPRISTIGALIVLALAVFGPVVASVSAQPASRYALTAALADHHTVDLGAYRRVIGVDHALYNGHLRSDKTPGQPILAVPVYAVGRAIGLDSATHLRDDGDVGLWLSTFATSFLPFLLLVWLMYRFVRRYAPDYALVAAAAIGFGSILLPHAVNLYGHDLAATLGFAAYVVADRPRGIRAGRLLAIGALLGAAVAVEYDAAILFIVVFAAVAQRERFRSLLALVGAVPFALLVAGYQWRAFGAPWHTPFAYYAGVINGTTRGGYTLPGLRNINDVLAGTRGLLLVSPIILVALGAAIWVARTFTGELRRHAIVALAVSAGFFILSTGWSGTPFLEEPGPRYMIPAFAFLALPLAVAWPRIAKIATIATIWGVVLMTLASLTFILLRVGDTPLSYFRYAWHRALNANLWEMAFGPAGVALYLATVAAAAWLVWRSFTGDRNDEQMFASEVAAD